MTILDNL